MDVLLYPIGATDMWHTTTQILYIVGGRPPKSHREHKRQRDTVLAYRRTETRVAIGLPFLLTILPKKTPLPCPFSFAHRLMLAKRRFVSFDLERVYCSVEK